MNRKLPKPEADTTRKTFVITYWMKWERKPLNISLFTGTKDEVVEMVGYLNYGRPYADIMNNDQIDGYFGWDDPPDLVTETGIRNRKDELIKNYY